MLNTVYRDALKIREEAKPSGAAKTAQQPYTTSEVIRYIYRMQIGMRAE